MLNNTYKFNKYLTCRTSLRGFTKINKILKAENDKRPLYVLVYNRLFSLIRKGYFKKGEILPPENEIAKKMGISRGTLRQALLILQKDGIIKSFQGKGNIVANINLNKVHGLENLKNPIIELGFEDDYDYLDIEIIFEPANNMLQEKLNVSSKEILIAVHRTYRSNNVRLGYGFSILPYKKFINFEQSIKEKIKLIKFLDSDIYDKVNSSNLRINLIDSGEYISEKLNISLNKKLFVFEEVCYGPNDPIMYFNLYIKPENYIVHINRTN